MEETDVFGVQNPEKDEIGFVSVTGSHGQQPSITVYCGAHALYQFLELLARDDLEMGSASETILEMSRLQASFEDRSYLQPQDIAVVTSLGLRYRGSKAWPMFRSHVPGNIPWFVDAFEARFLTHVLQQLADVAPRFREDHGLVDRDGRENFLVRAAERHGQSSAWSDRVECVAEPPPASIPFALPEGVADSLLLLPRGGEPLEADLFVVPALVGEKEGRAPYMYVLLMVGTQTGTVFGHEILTAVPSIEKMLGAVASHVADAIAEMGKRPIEIRVSSTRMSRLLQPLTMKIGIALELSKEIEMIALGEAREKLVRIFTRGY